MNFSRYSITLQANSAATDPPPAWNAIGNATYLFAASFASPPTVGYSYTLSAGYSLALTTDDGGVTYDISVENDTNEWVLASISLTDPPTEIIADFEESPGNTVNLTLTFNDLFVKDAAELIYGETATILEDTLTMNDGELGALDECTVDLLTAWPGYKADLTAVGLTKNALSTHPDIPGIFYVRNLRPKPEGSARAITTVSLIGILADEWEDRRLREISAFGQIVSVGPLEKIIIVTTASETGVDPEDDTDVPAKRRIPKLDAEGEVVYKTIVTPSGSAERWNINDPSITLTDTYFVREAPATDVIGQEITPVDPPTPPAYQWGTYAEPMRANHPNGWVLGDRKISIVIPGEVWKVVDTIDYYQAAIPD